MSKDSIWLLADKVIAKCVQNGFQQGTVQSFIKRAIINPHIQTHIFITRNAPLFLAQTWAQILKQFSILLDDQDEKTEYKDLYDKIKAAYKL